MATYSIYSSDSGEIVVKVTFSENLDCSVQYSAARDFEVQISGLQTSSGNYSLTPVVCAHNVLQFSVALGASALSAGIVVHVPAASQIRST